MSESSIADSIDVDLLIEAIDVKSESAWPVHCALRNLKLRPVAVLPNGDRRFVIALNCADDATQLLGVQRNDCKFQRASNDAAQVVKAHRQQELQSNAERPQRSKLNVPATKRMIGVALKNDELIAQANRELRRAERKQQESPAAPAPQVQVRSIVDSSSKQEKEKEEKEKETETKTNSSSSDKKKR
jgi:hypothetical protein